MAPPHTSRAPITAVDDGSTIMSVLRDWTEVKRLSPSNLAPNRSKMSYNHCFHKIGKIENRVVCHTTNPPSVERKTTPDLIRVRESSCQGCQAMPLLEPHMSCPHQGMTINHGQASAILEVPLSYPDPSSFYQSQEVSYLHHQVTNPKHHVTSPPQPVTSPRRSVISSGNENQLVLNQLHIASPQMLYEGQSVDPGQYKNFQTESKTSSWQSHGMPISQSEQEMLMDRQVTVQLTPSGHIRSNLNTERLKMNVTTDNDQSEESTVGCELYQSVGELNTYKSCLYDIGVQEAANDGTNAEDVDFYSKEHLRSISEMLIHDQSRLSTANRKKFTSSSILKSRSKGNERENSTNNVADLSSTFNNSDGQSEKLAGRGTVERDSLFADLFDYRSDLDGQRSYVHPPLYPFIPRAQLRRNHNRVFNHSVIPSQDKLSAENHKCCNCSFHENKSVSKDSTISPPFPHLLDDINNNIRIVCGGKLPRKGRDQRNSLSANPLAGTNFDRNTKVHLHDNLSKDGIQNDRNIHNPSAGMEMELWRRNEKFAALGHRERSSSCPTRRAGSLAANGDKVDRLQKEYRRREQSCVERKEYDKHEISDKICENSFLEEKYLLSQPLSFHSKQSRKGGTQNDMNIHKQSTWMMGEDQWKQSEKSTALGGHRVRSSSCPIRREGNLAANGDKVDRLLEEYRRRKQSLVEVKHNETQHLHEICENSSLEKKDLLCQQSLSFHSNYPSQTEGRVKRVPALRVRNDTLPQNLLKIGKTIEITSAKSKTVSSKRSRRYLFENGPIGGYCRSKLLTNSNVAHSKGESWNKKIERDAMPKDTVTYFSVPGDRFHAALDKESHHFDIDSTCTSSQNPPSALDCTGIGIYEPPDLILTAIATSSKPTTSFHEEGAGISEGTDHRGKRTVMEDKGYWSPIYRAPPLSEVKTPMQQWVESSVLQLELTEVDSVQQWLFDIRTNTDCESMCILQGKSIHNSPVNLEMTANTIKVNVLKLKTASKCLSAKFSQLHQKLSDDLPLGLWHTCRIIIQEIQAMITECIGFFVEIPSTVMSLQEELRQGCSKFKILIEDLEVNISHFVQSEDHLTSQLVNLGEQCALFVETVQTKLIQALVYSVQDSSSEFNIMVAVKTVHALITDYPSIKQILLQEQIASALFQVCLQTSFEISSLQLLSLQTIAKLCQDADGWIEIEKIGGMGYLSQMISSPTSSDALKIEAAALVGQLTAPETVSEYSQTRMHQHLEVLLKALTELIEQSSDPLVFLVISSAIANISFMGSTVYEYMSQQDAARVLVEGWRDGKVDTLNTKDQLVTIFANMAEDQGCREEIKQAGGISLLVTLLETQFIEGDTQGPDSKTDFDVKVCEQIQQKAAIALARLAKDITCAAEIDVCDGIALIARICRTSSYRNKSVPVLIACLAALRRLHHALGPSSFQEEDIDKLIRPKMIESIFTCSSMSEESFV